MRSTTSGQSNLTKAASPSHMNGSVVFARLRQCAPPSNACFLGPTRVHILNDISIGSAVFARVQGRDRETDYATSSVTVGRIYVPICDAA